VVFECCENRQVLTTLTILVTSTTSLARRIGFCLCFGVKLISSSQNANVKQSTSFPTKTCFTEFCRSLTSALRPNYLCSSWFLIIFMQITTVESRLYVQVGTQKFGRRTERDVQVKIIFRMTPCMKHSGRDYSNGTYKRVGLSTERRITETLL